MSAGVTTHRDGHVLEVTLARGKVNAIDVPTSQALAAAFQELHEDKDLRCAILTGGGDKIFSAGWDLKALNDGEMSLDNWWEADEYWPHRKLGVEQTGDCRDQRAGDWRRVRDGDGL
jgi:crotonobetainyl-CoA hydratase